MCGHGVQEMVVTMEIYYCKTITWYVKCSNNHLKAHCDGLLLYFANPGTKHRTTKGSTASNEHKIYSITAGSSYIQVPNP